MRLSRRHGTPDGSSLTHLGVIRLGSYLGFASTHRHRHVSHLGGKSQHHTSRHHSASPRCYSCHASTTRHDVPLRSTPRRRRQLAANRRITRRHLSPTRPFHTSASHHLMSHQASAARQADALRSTPRRQLVASNFSTARLSATPQTRSLHRATLLGVMQAATHSLQSDTRRHHKSSHAVPRRQNKSYISAHSTPRRHAPHVVSFHSSASRLAWLDHLLRDGEGNPRNRRNAGEVFPGLFLERSLPKFGSVETILEDRGAAVHGAVHRVHHLAVQLPFLGVAEDIRVRI